MKKILLLILFSIGSASAAEWKKIDSGIEMLLSIDVQSITNSGNSERKAWSEYIYSQLQDRKQVGKQFNRQLLLNIYDCAARTKGTMQVVFYGIEGDVIDSLSFKRNVIAMEDVIPESLGEASLNFVCAQPLKRK